MRFSILVSKISRISGMKRVLPGFIMAALLFAPLLHVNAQAPASASSSNGSSVDNGGQSTAKTHLPDTDKQDKHEESENEAYRHSSRSVPNTLIFIYRTCRWMSAIIVQAYWLKKPGCERHSP